MLCDLHVRSVCILLCSDTVSNTCCHEGTTGTPKGVDVTHRNVTNVVCHAPGNLGMARGSRVAQVLSISFDMGEFGDLQWPKPLLTSKGAWEILGSLSNGATLVLRGSDWHAALQQVSKYSKNIQCTISNPPTGGYADMHPEHTQAIPSRRFPQYPMHRYRWRAMFSKVIMPTDCVFIIHPTYSDF